MLTWNGARGAAVGMALGLVSLTGCEKPPAAPSAPPAANPGTPAPPSKPAVTATAQAADVDAARKRIEALGRSTVAPKEGALLTDIVIQDGSSLTADDIALFGKLSDLKKLQIFNCRALDDAMVGKLTGLKGLTSLALTNTVLNDVSVTAISTAFPDLVDLDLSSNTNMTKGVVKILSTMPKLQRLTLVQNRIDDIGAQRLEKLQELRALDLRGNMEAGDMALEVVGGLPKLSGFKHRSTAVNDSGMESLSKSQTIESLLIQDFAITDQSGPHLAKLGKLSQLEVFRCQGFGTEGVLALKGMGLTRLTLRDLPNVDDRAMEVFDDLPKLRRLYLHELASVSDSGLSHLANLKSLELLDIWSVPQMTDATLDVILALPNLKELAIRTTGVTDAAIDKILAKTTLTSLTFKENGSVTPEAAKKLSSRKWDKLDLGTGAAADSE